MFYSLRKILSREQRIDVLRQLNDAFEVSEVDQTVITRALHSDWKDFEDAVQNYAAVADPRVSAIITRNVKDFRNSELEVLDSLDFLK
jgi:purine nucleoside permease